MKKRKVGRPKIKRRDRKVQACFNLKQSELNRLQRIIDYKNISRSEIIGILVKKYNNTEEKKIIKAI